MLSIFILWHKTPLIPPPQNDHKSNLFPWHKSVLCWRCFREFMVHFKEKISSIMFYNCVQNCRRFVRNRLASNGNSSQRVTVHLGTYEMRC